MKLRRIYAVLLKSFYVTKRSPDKWADIVYWATIDLVVWGLTSNYFTSFAPNSHILEIIISGILFWTIIWRAQQEISVNLLEDVWNRNLMNVFVSPFAFKEWIVSFLVVSIVKAGLSFFTATFIAILLYKVNVFVYGIYVVPFVIILFTTAWGIGFFISGLIMRFGQKVQNLAWSFVSIVAPFSGIYYPITILPHWAQYVARIFPTSYIFEEIHTVIQTGHADWKIIGIGFTLSIVYLTVALWFLYSSFQLLLKKGLSHI